MEQLKTEHVEKYEELTTGDNGKESPEKYDYLKQQLSKKFERAVTRNAMPFTCPQKKGDGRNLQVELYEDSSRMLANLNLLYKKQKVS